jgi:hypothetical protein
VRQRAEAAEAVAASSSRRITTEITEDTETNQRKLCANLLLRVLRGELFFATTTVVEV